jgi:hypothetical protein
VPLGLRHISLRLNSLTLASSGVIVAHLTPTLYFLIASAESTVTWSLVWAWRVSSAIAFAREPSTWMRGLRSTHRIAVLHPQVVVFEVDVDVWQNELYPGISTARSTSTSHSHSDIGT